MPLGIRCSLSSCSPARTVCPALFPPWYRTTKSMWSATKSVTLPLPSSPHWVPTRMVAGIAAIVPRGHATPLLSKKAADSLVRGLSGCETFRPARAAEWEDPSPVVVRKEHAREVEDGSRPDGSAGCGRALRWTRSMLVAEHI